jgi:hypothetical protein
MRDAVIRKTATELRVEPNWVEGQAFSWAAVADELGAPADDFNISCAPTPKSRRCPMPSCSG